MPEVPRTVIHADSLEWLPAHPPEPKSSVVTSLPDVSELPHLGFDGWKRWFIQAAGAVLRWIPEQAVAMFYQSDIRRGGAWVDKAHLVMLAADELGIHLVFHKIVCRKPPGTVSFGRASYSHLLCFQKSDPAVRPRSPGADVLEATGAMPSAKSMGVEACRLACRFLLSETDTRLLVDPFCGEGTILAVANQMGLPALGIDISAKRCRAARKLEVCCGNPGLVLRIRDTVP